jgi:hypothetical protein
LPSGLPQLSVANSSAVLTGGRVAYCLALQEIVFVDAFGFALGVVVVDIVDVVDVVVVELPVVDVLEPPCPLAVCVRLATPSAVATPADATSTVRSERLNRCT